MLILSRKLNESIVIGDNIRITVASIRGRYVRIGIEAPGDVPIYREELLLDQGDDRNGHDPGPLDLAGRESARLAETMIAVRKEKEAVALDT